jgi:hypothetical protein
MATPVIRWAIPGVLARSCRPGYPAVRVPLSEVEAWLVAVLAKGISSVLCLLSNGEIELYYRRRYYSWCFSFSLINRSCHSRQRLPKPNGAERSTPRCVESCP